MRGPVGVGSDRYILDDNDNPVVESDLMKWAKWLEQPGKRQLAYNELRNIRVSTVFLGLDHSFFPEGKKPLLFETMVFDNNKNKSNYDQFQDRYYTKKEALRGHLKILKKLFTEEEITLSNLKK